MTFSRWFGYLIMSVSLVVSLTVSAANGGKGIKLRGLAAMICTNFSSSGNNIAKDSRRHIMNYMKEYEGIPNPSVKQIVTFLNKNKDKMTCASWKKRSWTEKEIQHNYMMEAFDRGAHRGLFRELFINQFYRNERNVKIDINAVSYSGPKGKPITVVDYINLQLADPRLPDAYKKEINDVKSLFVKRFGAKTFDQLPKDLQQQYLKK